jgi:AraC family transcriptional regulator
VLAKDLKTYTAPRGDARLLAQDALAEDWLADGQRKYPRSKLLLSSANRGWDTLSAELRSHSAGRIVSIEQQSVEVVIALAGTDGPVTRIGAGRQEQTRPDAGTVWLVPTGVGPEEIVITTPMPRTLHLYMPMQQFDSLADQYNLGRSLVRSVQYIGGLNDDLIRQVGTSVLTELSEPTATSRMVAEMSSLMLATRLIQNYVDRSLIDRIAGSANRLDHTRMRRVLDYIDQNLEEAFTVEDLAALANLSLFHFAHMFTNTMGMPPQRYVSRRRLNSAMRMIATGKIPLSEIAFRSGFSSQASFTRAFRRATNMTPGEFREHRS